MRARALLLATLTLAAAPAVTTAQQPPTTREVPLKVSSKTDPGMPQQVGNIQDSMDPALKGLISGPDSLMGLADRSKGLNEYERERLADDWRAKKSKEFGLGPNGSGSPGPVMSLSDLEQRKPRPKLVLSSEKERREKLLEELRTHAAYDAKIDRIIELAEERKGKKSELYGRAKALHKLEAKRHARTTIRIRAAKIDPEAEASAKTAPANAPTDSVEASK